MNFNIVPKGDQPSLSSATLDLRLHVGYAFGTSPFSIALSYLDAIPLGSCSTPGPPLVGNCVNTADRLPGYPQNSFPDAYLQYKDTQFTLKMGNQLIDTPWATSSTHSRIDPSAFQGIDLRYALSKALTLEGSDFVRFKPGESSTFARSTRLTSADTLPNNIYNPSGTSIETTGYVYGHLGYTGGNAFSADLHYYGIQNIANIFWVDASYPIGKTKMKPFINLQGGSERSIGAAVIGQINSNVVGVQTGLTFTPTLSATVGYNAVSNHTDMVTLPAGYTCPAAGAASANVIAVNPLLTKTSLPYFLPIGGTGNCMANANGTTTLSDGGWASPYSDSDAADPLFTTPMLEGLVDRRSPGAATSVRLQYTSLGKQFVGYVSETFFDYKSVVSRDSTNETDVDALYHFSHMRATPYQGLFFHYQYGDLSKSAASANLGYTFNKFQLEYDF